MKQSILNDQMNNIYTATDIDSARAIFKGVVEASRISPFNKRTMLINADRIGSLIELQTYATNSMFKFNGMGLS